MATPRAAQGERAMFFPFGEDSLFAVLTAPAGQPRGVAAIVLPGAQIPTPGFGRENTNLCRRLAAEGFHAVRFDYHGMGDSTGVPDRPSLRRPLVADLESVVEAMRGEGLHRFLVIGHCLGARSALAWAAEAEAAADLVLIAPPLRDFNRGERAATGAAVHLSAGQYVRRALRPRVLRRLGDPRWRRRYRAMAAAKLRTLGAKSGGRSARGRDGWVSEPFLHQLERISSRNVRAVLLYGDRDDFWSDFQLARSGRTGRLLERSPFIDVRTVPGTLHDFRDLEKQRVVHDAVLDWVLGVGGEPRSVGSGVGLQLD